MMVSRWKDQGAISRDESFSESWRAIFWRRIRGRLRCRDPTCRSRNQGKAGVAMLVSAGRGELFIDDTDWIHFQSRICLGVIPGVTVGRQENRCSGDEEELRKHGVWI